MDGAIHKAGALGGQVERGIGNFFRLSRSALWLRLLVGRCLIELKQVD
jgi:hypothetical protein